MYDTISHLGRVDLIFKNILNVFLKKGTLSHDLKIKKNVRHTVKGFPPTPSRIYSVLSLCPPPEITAVFASCVFIKRYFLHLEMHTGKGMAYFIPCSFLLDKIAWRSFQVST